MNCTIVQLQGHIIAALLKTGKCLRSFEIMALDLLKQILDFLLHLVYNLDAGILTSLIATPGGPAP
jgi:hypothetical protein